MEQSFWMPTSNSTIASDVDGIFYFVYWCAVFFFALVVAGMVLFAVKYRRTSYGKTDGPSHSNTLELVWTLIPTVLVFIVFGWGFKDYIKMSVAPKDALEVKVTGQKWFWTFEYADGVTSVNELVIPKGKPVKFLMSSKDVIHCLYFPEFRTKRDVLPNRYTVNWIEAINTGTFQIFCAEYCGTKHSEMVGHVKVVTDAEFATWIESNSSTGEGMSLEEFGQKLYVSKACVTCHSVDGKPGNGPSWKGIFGKREKLADGSAVLIDENYLRESMLNPQAKITAGFQPIMPTYQGILRDREIDALIAYIKTLKAE